MRSSKDIAPVRSIRAPHGENAAQARALALLGEAPILTFTADRSDADSCVSVRLMRAGSSWWGFVDDHAVFADRVRMGMRPRFVLHVDGDTPTVGGECDVRLHGPLAESAEVPASIPAPAAAVVRAMAAAQPFGIAGSVVVEVTPALLQVDDGEDPGHGAVPRT